MKETKFRVWNEVRTKFVIYDIRELLCGDARVDGLHSSTAVDEWVGVKSKSGVEIYEGDIIQFDYYKGFSGVMRTCISVVEFVQGSFGFYEYYNEVNDCFFNVYDLSDVEIIGNVYRNPELLPCQT